MVRDKKLTAHYTTTHYWDLEKFVLDLMYSTQFTCVGDYRSPRGMISSLIKNSMVSSSQSSTLLSSSSVSTPARHTKMSALLIQPQRRVNGESDKSERPHLLWARGGCSSVPDKSSAPSPGTAGTPPSLPCAYPPAPAHTHRDNQIHNSQGSYFSVNTRLG